MTKRALLTITTVGLLGLTGCDDGNDRPLDGTWQVTSLTCDGVDQPIGQFTLTVDGDRGTFVQQFTPDCVATLQEDYAYPDDSSFTITPTSIDCSPSSGCAALFGADCLPLSPPVTFDYERNGSTLTFTMTASGPADPCPVGQDVVFTMQRQ